jgi:hypothetical protein
MQTIRTFSKPTDPIVSYEFQSNVFDREVAFRGPGTGYDYRVYQRNDIDWGMVRNNPDNAPNFIGKTNLDAAKAGIAPELVDGSIVNLHHVGQNSSGPLVEVSTRLHSRENQQAFDALHSQFGKKGKHPTNPVDRPKFDKDRAAYWKWMAENVSKK